MSAPTSPTVVNRSSTGLTDDDSNLSEDTSEVTRLFNERLQAWKHACGYLEDYVKTTEKMQHTHGKEYEKVLKTINSPLREGEHFDRTQSGIAGLFDVMRTNTQSISNAHTQTAQTLKSTVLPVFEKLHSEVKAKQKELSKGVGKGNKAVEKARQETQKHIDLLNTHAAGYERLTAKDASNDPYILQRGIYHRLHKQYQEENNNRSDMLAVQNSFSQFETHIVQTFQQGLSLFVQTVSSQCDQQKAFYQAITQTASGVDPMFEWTRFVQRNNTTLIDPNAPQKTVSSATFPAQNHTSTQPLVQGLLDRKSGLLKKFDTASYVVTPGGFLHEFKSGSTSSSASNSDDLAKDPSPELSLYLPDCVIGALNGNLFTVKGKDVSKSKVGSLITSAKDYEFRAAQGHDAETWYGILKGMVGTKPGDTISPPMSPPPAEGAAGANKQLGSSVSPQSSLPSREVSGAGSGSGAGAGGDTATTTTPTAATGTTTATTGTAGTGTAQKTEEGAVGQAL